MIFSIFFDEPFSSLRLRSSDPRTMRYGEVKDMYFPRTKGFAFVESERSRFNLHVLMAHNEHLGTVQTKHTQENIKQIRRH